MAKKRKKTAKKNGLILFSVIVLLIFTLLGLFL